MNDKNHKSLRLDLRVSLNYYWIYSLNCIERYDSETRHRLSSDPHKVKGSVGTFYPMIRRSLDKNMAMRQHGHIKWKTFSMHAFHMYISMTGQVMSSSKWTTCFSCCHRNRVWIWNEQAIFVLTDVGLGIHTRNETQYLPFSLIQSLCRTCKS